MSHGLLTPEEVQHYLETDRAGLDRLIRSKKLTAYKLGGTYLRFPKEQVMALRSKIPQKSVVSRPGIWAKVWDFWRYNGFYFISAGLLMAILYFALQ